MSNDWAERIVTLALVKQDLAKADKEQLWPYHLPSLAASKDELDAVESYLGFKLDKEYRAFLDMANGWKGFFQYIDLFGTTQLLGSPDMEYACGLLESIDDDVFRTIGFSRNEFMAIASTRHDKDVFVISTSRSTKPGIVIWLAGEEVERFESFTDFFLSMIDYNRQELEEMKEE